MKTICDFLYAQLGETYNIFEIGGGNQFNIWKIGMYIITINESHICVAGSYRPLNEYKTFIFDECDKVVTFLTIDKHKYKFN